MSGKCWGGRPGPGRVEVDAQPKRGPDPGAGPASGAAGEVASL
jgi:hypothetical protein